jgi:hypothetical protein
MGDVTSATLERAADRLASLLTGAPGPLADPRGSDLEFEAEVRLRLLARGTAPADAWAVDGGQALVADARCLQVVVTRAARVRFRDGACVEEDEGVLRAAVLGAGEGSVARAELRVPGLAADAPVDVHLLRDRWEWDGVARSVDQCEAGGVVLVDGDLAPDWRLPDELLGGILTTAAERGVVVAAVTKHSSLARAGAPLLGLLELEAEALLGPRATWWAPVARRPGRAGPDIRVVAARLDPDARFAFRIDLPADVDAEGVLGQLAALSDDAAFPGYPYPLSVADRLAACPGWLRADVRLRLEELLDANGVPLAVRERAFADRHDLMERA